MSAAPRRFSTARPRGLKISPPRRRRFLYVWFKNSLVWFIMYAHVSGSTSGSASDSYFEPDVEPEAESGSYHLYLTPEFSTENRHLSTVYAQSFPQVNLSPEAQKNAPISRHASLLNYGPLDRIRTCDHRNRNPVLYPAELRAVIYPYIIPHLPPFVNPQSRFFLIFVKIPQLIKAESDYLPQSYILRKNSKTLLTNRFRCGIILTLLRDNANQIRERSRVAKGDRL